MTDVDVLIVGGGPAGLATAEGAAPHGRVLVVHKDKAIGRPVRTSGGSWKRAVEALGIPETLYHPIDALQFATPGHRYRFAFESDPPVILDVTGTYRFLAARAARAGAEIRCGHRLESVEPGAERVTCRVRGPDGAYELRARYLVDASGGWRAALSRVGAATRPPRAGLGVEYELENRTPGDRTATLFVGTRFAPSGYGWIFPTREGTTRVGIGVIRPDSDASPGSLLRQFLASPWPSELALAAGALVESHAGAIPSEGALPAFLFGRIVAVGDSAGQALPLLGEGIRYAVEAGRRLGDILADSLAAGAHRPEALAAYAGWWNRRYRRRFRLAQGINERIARYGDSDWDAALRVLRHLSGDELSALLRMELGLSALAKMARHQPRLLLKLLRTGLSAGALTLAPGAA